jgi:hypothetical protein
MLLDPGVRPLTVQAVVETFWQLLAAMLFRKAVKVPLPPSHVKLACEPAEEADVIEIGLELE